MSDRERRVLGIIETARAKRPRFKDELVTMAHGAGGKATQTLIEGLLRARLRLPGAGGAGRRRRGRGRRASGLAMTTDSFVVRPIRFPGGSIGELAVNGTVNDLAVSGARPLALTLSLVLEEGLAANELRAEVEAIAAAAEAAGVESSGATPRWSSAATATACTCARPASGGSTRAPRSSHRRDRPGDRMLVSGPVGAHGTAIMLARGEFELEAEVESDTRSLWPAVEAMLEAAGPSLRCLRDATRGGVGLGAQRAGARPRVASRSARARVPVLPAVAGAAELLGIDPMYIANEGMLVAFVAPEGADAALAALRSRARLRGGGRDRRGPRRAAGDGAGRDRASAGAG